MDRPARGLPSDPHKPDAVISEAERDIQDILAEIEDHQSADDTDDDVGPSISYADEPSVYTEPDDGTRGDRQQVPVGALRALRQDFQESKRELAAAREANALMQQQMQALTTGLAANLNLREPQEPPPNPDAIPSYDDDPDGWASAIQTGYQRQIDGLRQRLDGAVSGYQRDAALAAADQALYASYERDPSMRQAAEHVVRTYVNAVKSYNPGLDDTQAAQIAIQQQHRDALLAAQRGQDFAAFTRQLATSYGWQPSGKSGRRSGGIHDLDSAIAASAASTRDHGQYSGDDILERLANAPLKEHLRNREKFNNAIEKLMGEGEI